MYRWIVLASLAVLLGCDTQPIEARCENNSDCDRATTGATARCVSIANNTAPCTTLDCICCPIGPVDPALYPRCVPRTSDVTVTDAADVQADVGGDVATDGPTEGGDVSSDVPVDAAPRQLGQMCTAANQCVTGFCAQGVCCNSACACPGCSCFTAPDFAGICMRVMSGGDAGGDAGADVTAD